MKNKTDFERIGAIISDVKKNGDKAVIKYIQMYDGLRLKPSELRVSKSRIREALKKVKPSVMAALEASAESIAKFSSKEKSQIRAEWVFRDGGKKITQRTIPIESVAVYAPGGRFSYPSSVLMGAIPAKTAGVKNVFVLTPPKKITPEVLAACFLAGVDGVYSAGGPAAIAAAAYGTKTIPKADKIVGPGNTFVALAKSAVSKDVGVDMIAGPSEIAVLCDDTADADFVSADLLAQLEHDSSAEAALVSLSDKTASMVLERVPANFKKRIKLRKASSISQAVDIINEMAPEHLELACANAARVARKISNAAAVFAGNYSFVALGDYIAGPSHVLPTGASARFSSGLSVHDFLKRINVIEYTRKKSFKDSALASLIAESEGMTRHKNSLELRIKK